MKKSGREIAELPKTVATLIMYAQSIIAAMTGKTRSPSRLPTIAVVSAAIVTLQQAD